MTARWTGMYVKQLNVQIDLDHDGTTDVIFYKDGTSKPTGLPSSCTPVAVGGNSMMRLTGTDSGYLTWSDADPRTWYDDGRQYYYPIPAAAILHNKNIKQNPHWDK